MFASLECDEGVHAQLLHAASAAAPAEVCAVLGGERVTHAERGVTARVLELFVLPNRCDAAHDAFTIDPVAFARCEHALRRSGLQLLGFAHSHPGGSTAPSLRDRAQLWTGCVQVITDGQRADAFVLDAERRVHPLPLATIRLAKAPAREARA